MQADELTPYSRSVGHFPWEFPLGHISSDISPIQTISLPTVDIPAVDYVKIWKHTNPYSWP